MICRDRANFLKSPICAHLPPQIYVHSPINLVIMDSVNIFYVILILIALAIVFSCAVSVNQGYIYVITMFGKYQRILRPGLNFKIPFLEQLYKKISIQNPSVTLEFQSVTAPQPTDYSTIL